MRVQITSRFGKMQITSNRKRNIHGIVINEHRFPCFHKELSIFPPHRLQHDDLDGSFLRLSLYPSGNAESSCSTIIGGVGNMTALVATKTSFSGNAENLL